MTFNPRPFGRTENRTGKPRDWYHITNKTDDTDTVADVYIYGVIGDSWFDDSVPATQFVREFDAIEADRINIRINSPGGYVDDGIAILNSVRRHKAHKTVHVDGLAASAASFIAMGGDELIMGRNSELMIHDASMVVWGNSADMVKAAERLDKTSDNIATIYAEKAGGDPKAWREAMKTESWYSADEAVEAGLADRVDTAPTDDDPADVENRFDLSLFNFAGRTNAPAPMFPAVNGPDPAKPDSTHHLEEEGTDMASDTLISGLRERLGFAEDVNDDQILAAVDEALTERAETTNEIPEGSVLVDQATLTDLQAAAEEGRQARAQQVADHRVAVVDKAVNEGRIAPARRDHWLTQLEADPGVEDVLNSLEPVIPVEPNGYTGGVNEAPDDDTNLYARAWGDDKKEN